MFSLSSARYLGMTKDGERHPGRSILPAWIFAPVPRFWQEMSRLHLAHWVIRSLALSCFLPLSDRAHPLSLLIATSDTFLIVQSRRSHLISPLVASNLSLGLQPRSHRFVSYVCSVPIFILPFLSSSQCQPFFATVSSRFPVCCSLELRVLPVAFR